MDSFDLLGTPLGHLGFALAALAFAVRDIFWLRCLAIAASVAMITYALHVHEHWFALVFWQSVFIVVNAAWLAYLLFGERRARFSADEEELYQTAFRGFTRLEFLRLLRLGQWRSVESGVVLAREGEPVPDLVFVACGRADVAVGGRSVAEIRSGQFVGEMSLMTGETASATVTVAETTKCLAWTKDDLDRLLRRNPSMRFVMDTLVGVDLSGKLKASRSTGGGGAEGV